MAPILILLLIAALPVVLALLFRVSSLCLFAASAAGALLVKYLGDDVWLAVNMFVKGPNTQFFVQLSLLFLPVLLTLFFTRKSLPKSKILLHLVPIIANGLLIAAIAIPLLPPALQSGIFAVPIGGVAKRSQDIMVGAAVVLNLLLMWQLNRSNHHEGAGKKHK